MECELYISNMEDMYTVIGPGALSHYYKKYENMSRIKRVNNERELPRYVIFHWYI